MREISYKELQSLIKSAQTYEFQEQYRKFAQEFYGPTADKCVIVTCCEYNDSTYDDEINDITVYDKDGKVLPVIETHVDIQNQYDQSIKWAKDYYTAEILKKASTTDPTAIRVYVDNHIKNGNYLRDAIQQILYDRYQKLEFPNKRSEYFPVEQDQESQELVIYIGEKQKGKLPKIYVDDNGEV